MTVKAKTASAWCMFAFRRGETSDRGGVLQNWSGGLHT